MSIEQVVAGMPRADIEIPVMLGDAIRQLGIMSQWRDKLLKAQCKLLAEQGYRKVPSMEELLKYLRQPLLYEHYKSWTSKSFAEELHRWLLEGE